MGKSRDPKFWNSKLLPMSLFTIQVQSGSSSLNCSNSESFDQIHQISFKLKHLEPFLIFNSNSRLNFEKSNKESCSLFNFLHIHILIEIFRIREVHLLIESSHFLLKFFWINQKTYCSYWAEPTATAAHTPSSSPRPMGLVPPSVPLLHAVGARPAAASAMSVPLST
jgi:hypothetical protein